jgi:hypothetical protein
LLSFCSWLEHSSWITVISNTAWLYAIFEVLHYFSLFVLVGSIVIVDLSILGVVGRSQTVPRLAEQLFPWMWTGFGVAVLSGFIMFATGAIAYFPDKVFRVKMLVILLAVIFAIGVERNVPKWGQSPRIPLGAKLVALISLFLWIGTILAGVEISAISGLG